MFEYGRQPERLEAGRWRPRVRGYRSVAAIGLSLSLVAALLLPASAAAAAIAIAATRTTAATTATTATAGATAGEEENEQKTIPAFGMSSTSTSGNVITISIAGTALADVYAYEIGLRFDAKRFRLTKASSDWPGMSINGKRNGGKLRFAHTMVGKSAGRYGSAPLATLTFERIRGGNAAFMLEEVKLVDSLLQVGVYENNAEIIARSEGTRMVWNDMSGHWAEANAIEAAELGLVGGYPDGSFRPQQAVTRAEFAVMLSRTMQLDGPRKQAGEQESVAFVDAADMPEWALSHIAAVQKSGIATGYSDGTFRPLERISRAEMAVMLARALSSSSELEAVRGKVVVNAGSQSAGEKRRFQDWMDVPTWALQEIELTLDNELMRGKNQQRFAPLDNVTRAEAMQAMLNLLG